MTDSPDTLHRRSLEQRGLGAFDVKRKVSEGLLIAWVQQIQECARRDDPHALMFPYA